MHKELIICAGHSKIEANNISKIITIANWIGGSQKMKSCNGYMFYRRSRNFKSS